jgi:hypothetical protein
VEPCEGLRVALVVFDDPPASRRQGCLVLKKSDAFLGLR